MEDEIRKVSECINRGRNYFNYMIFIGKNKEINNSNYTKIYIDTLCSFIKGYGFEVSPIYFSLTDVKYLLDIYGNYCRYFYINDNDQHKLYIIPNYEVPSYEKYIKEKDLDKNKG